MSSEMGLSALLKTNFDYIHQPKELTLSIFSETMWGGNNCVKTVGKKIQ